MQELQKNEKGTFLHAKFLDRAAVSGVRLREGVFYADCRAYPELEDLDSRSRRKSWTITGRLSVKSVKISATGSSM